MAKVYGIDLGTTYSVISTLDENGMPKVIPNQNDGSDLLASAVYFPEGGSPVVGEVAKSQKDVEPERVVEFVKRFIGKSDAPSYEYDGVTYDPISISALILKQIKKYADEQGENVENVVITCPAYFGNEEKAATRQAGELAGFNVLNIVHEPTAAALNYCSREYNESRKIMVYDLGGGTFDVTLIDFVVDETGKTLVDVIRTGGDDRLGGVDWDDRMYEYMREKFAEENGTDKDDMDSELIATIKAQVEQAKKDLSSLEKKSYTIKHDGDRVRIELLRSEFEERSQDLVQRTMSFVDQLLSDADVTADDVDLALLVGGSTFMPMIRSAVENRFPGKTRVEQPNLAVAKGAAISAALEFNERLHQIEEKASGGQEITEEEKQLVGGGSGVGVDVRQASRAATIALPSMFQRFEVSDKLTRSLGPAVVVHSPVAKPEDYMIDNLLFIGDEFPAEAEGMYGTVEENQSEVVVNVFENRSEDRQNKHVLPSKDINGADQYTDPALNVRLIGEVHLELPPNTRMGAPIRVVFKADARGLDATVVNVETGQSGTVRIESDNTYSQEKLKEEKERLRNVQTSGNF